MAVFLRFKASNILNLLCLQSEISELEEKLSKVTDIDDKSTDPVKCAYSNNWSTLMEKGKDSQQWKIASSLRSKLKDYNEALLQQIALHNQVGPSHGQMQTLQVFLKDHHAGLGSSLRGPGCMSWRPTEEGGRPKSDLMVFSSKSVEVDSLTRWASTALAPALTWVLGLFPSFLVPQSQFLPEEPWDEHSYVMYGTGPDLVSIGDKFTSFLAVILILVPVILLHFVNDANSRLIIIIAFSLGFTLVLVVATNASRSEIFGASAAFVAVQVVYVGSALTNV